MWHYCHSTSVSQYPTSNVLSQMSSKLPAIGFFEAAAFRGDFFSLDSCSCSSCSCSPSSSTGSCWEIRSLSAFVLVHLVRFKTSKITFCDYTGLTYPLFSEKIYFLSKFTGWPFSLCKTSCWLQDKISALAWPGQGRPGQSKTFVLKCWSQPEVLHKLNGHPVLNNRPK